jgi:6-phosphogluconolactonase (cycloisomerase 2 family)
VIAWIIYSNYQAERRALVEALKATALAQYQATVTVQAQATATTRAQATAQAQAAVADSCNPSADQVALFVDANYGGQCVVKGVGQYSNPSAIGLPNDSITSIRVGSNVQATLYEHDDYQGRSETFTSGDSSLRDNTISDDAVSSVKVQWRTSAVEITATAQAQDRATAQARAAATVQARATATVQARATAAITAAEVTGTPRQMTTIADSSPCSDIIMVGSADAKVYKIDIGTEKIIEKTTLSNIQMGLLAWNQTRNEVYGADYNGDVVSIVQPDPLREIGSIRQNVGWNAYSIAVSPDGSVMYLTFSWGGDNASYRQAVVLDPVARVSVGKVRLTDTYGEAYLALSSDGKYLYVSWDSNIDVYSTSDMSLIQHNTLAAGWSGRLAVSSDDRYLYICQADQLVKWNIGTGTTEEIISLPGVSGYSWIEMSDDGQRVWVGSSNANRVYEVQTSFANYRAIDLQGIPYSFVQSSDGLCLYSTSFEEGVSAVDLSTGEIVRAIPNIQYATGLIVVSYERQ